MLGVVTNKNISYKMKEQMNSNTINCLTQLQKEMKRDQPNKIGILILFRLWFFIFFMLL